MCDCVCDCMCVCNRGGFVNGEVGGDDEEGRVTVKPQKRMWAGWVCVPFVSHT